MGNIYVLFRCNGGLPCVEHLRAFTRISAAKAAAQEIEGELEWPEDRAAEGLWFTAPNRGEWETYGIARLTLTGAE